MREGRDREMIELVETVNRHGSGENIERGREEAREEERETLQTYE